MAKTKKIPRTKLRKIAYLEASALLQADMDSADLYCEEGLSEEDSGYIREYIRDVIAEELRMKGQFT